MNRGLARVAPVAWAMLSSSAFAHAQLQQAEPAVGGTLAASPSAIRLHFSEGVEPVFSTIALATEAGAPVGLSRPGTAPGDATILICRVLKALKPGTYQVTWHAVSVDTHKTQGSFSFTVAP
jgi:methionine-rich copper-binding protein CopC